VSDEASIWEAVQAMLFASPIDEAEEWAIHDYEGFEGAEVGEYYSFANVVELADYIRERGELGAQVLNYYGGNIEDAKARFEEYAGEYDSLEAYAEELTEQSGETIPERLARLRSHFLGALRWPVIKLSPAKMATAHIVGAMS